MSYEQGRCPNDGHMRRVVTLHTYAGELNLRVERWTGLAYLASISSWLALAKRRSAT